MQTHNTGVVGSIPPCFTYKTPSVRKATVNHLMNSTSLEKTQSPISGFCSARNRVCNAVSFLSSANTIVPVLTIDGKAFTCIKKGVDVN